MGSFTDLSIDELASVIPSLVAPEASPAVATARILIVGGSIGGLAAAACLRAAGFTKVQVFERCPGLGVGAGLGLDDASLGILKGLGVVGGSGTLPTASLQRLRWTEERTVEGQIFCRQPYPYCATLYSALQQALAALLPEDVVTYGKKVVAADMMPNQSVHVHSEDGSTTECDLLIAADGPRSAFREQVASGAGTMRYAGYFGWRGIVSLHTLPADTVAALKQSYPDFGNCLYCITSAEPRASAVLYDIGDGLVNWLIYENRTEPRAPPGRTITAASAADISCFRSTAKQTWGEALGGIIEATEEPFCNDIYDLQDPLATFFKESIALLGDAAHAVTPHMAKGSNLALHDAFALATAACGADSLQAMLKEYSAVRAQEGARYLLLSRHLGRLRNGLLPCSKTPPVDGAAFEAALRSQGLPLRTLPIGDLFRPTWAFAEARLSQAERGFWLQLSETCGASRRGKRKIACMDGEPSSRSQALDGHQSAQITCVNHVSLETGNVDRLRTFYCNVLGLTPLTSPDFGFGVARLQPQRGIALHIIQHDPEKRNCLASQPSAAERPPECFIRRSHHLALTVPDIDATKEALDAHGVRYAVNRVPDTSIIQLCLYDPDGNGLELGNFDSIS